MIVCLLLFYEYVSKCGSARVTALNDLYLKLYKSLLVQLQPYSTKSSIGRSPIATVLFSFPTKRIINVHNYLQGIGVLQVSMD